MLFREYPPSPLLADDVKCMWILRTTYPADGFEDVTPDGCVELICNLGCPYRLPSDGRALPPVFVVGFQERTVRFPVSGEVRLIAARLHPWAATWLLEGEIDATGNVIAGLGGEWNDLLAALEPIVAHGDESAFARAADCLQEFLIGRAMARGFHPSVFRAAARLLADAEGQLRVEALADECSISVRQLQRAFRRSLGATPKSYARTVRFAAAQRVLQLNPSTSLARLAYQCGYADQAHFVRDFKELSGRTPGEYAKHVSGLRELIRSRDVVFLQSPDPRPR